jgi:hypothetical protein
MSMQFNRGAVRTVEEKYRQVKRSACCFVLNLLDICHSITLSPTQWKTLYVNRQVM